MTTEIPPHRRLITGKLIGIADDEFEQNHSDGSTTISPALLIRVGQKTDTQGKFEREHTRTMRIVFDAKDAERFKEYLIHYIDKAVSDAQTHVAGLSVINEVISEIDHEPEV